MISRELERARAYEAREGKKISPEERPLFHLTPTVGWLNDPNGFSFYGGEYHIFYQYHPYSVKWGPMHWGHCKSRDLLHWERLPAALAPDQDYDRDGCFSGSGVELPDGRHLLMYTGVKKTPGEGGEVIERQTQCLAVGDGINYEKRPGGPVLDERDLPAGGSPVDFRDPKLWREDGLWKAAVANRTEDGSGAILLYTSPDLDRWTLAGVLDRSRNRLGRMWECPDLFRLDGQGVLLTSPQELTADGPEFHNGHEVLCLMGDYDGKHFTRRSVSPVDQGLDFYASQTLLAPDGRRIMVGWLQAWESSKFVPAGQPWFGMLSLPRELRVKDGRLIQTPVRELEACRYDPAGCRDLLLEGERTLPGVSGRAADLSLRLRPAPGRACRAFTLTLAAGGSRRTTLTYRPRERELILDRTYSGFPYHIAHRRAVPVAGDREELELRVILDRFSVEIFVNGGEQVLSAALYTPQEAQEIRFRAEGAALLDAECYRLK